MIKILDQILILNELQFETVARKAKNDLSKIYKILMLSGLDDISLGFWIWDIPKKREIYSPKFRSSLQYESIEDFPNVPDSWQKAIDPNDLKIALNQYKLHVATKGEHPYLSKVKYNRKYKGKITVYCHGKVVIWDGDRPQIMIGVHLNKDGLFEMK